MEKLKKNVLSSRFFFIAVSIFSFIALLFMLFPDTWNLLGVNILVFWVLLALSGVGLIMITYKERISGKLKFFLLSSGFSAAGFFLGVVFHNLLYALATLVEEISILHTFINFLEATFFMIAVIICPLGLIIGLIGTLILWKNMPAIKKDG